MRTQNRWVRRREAEHPVQPSLEPDHPRRHGRGVVLAEEDLRGERRLAAMGAEALFPQVALLYTTDTNIRGENFDP